MHLYIKRLLRHIGLINSLLHIWEFEGIPYRDSNIWYLKQILKEWDEVKQFFVFIWTTHRALVIKPEG